MTTLIPSRTARHGTSTPARRAPSAERRAPTAQEHFFTLKRVLDRLRNGEVNRREREQ